MFWLPGIFHSAGHLVRKGKYIDRNWDSRLATLWWCRCFEIWFKGGVTIAAVRHRKEGSILPKRKALHHRLSFSDRLWRQPHHSHGHVHVSQLPDALLPQLRMLLVVAGQPRQPVWTGLWRVPLGASSELHFRFSGCMYKSFGGTIHRFLLTQHTQVHLFFIFDIWERGTFKQNICINILNRIKN